MADPNYPFVEDQPQGPALADPMAAQRSSEWAQALSDPQLRGALLQFGVNMLQPPSFGDTFGSQFGRAVGSVGEQQSRVEAEDIRRSEAQSKQDLRASQAETGAQRAEAATARAGAAQTAANAASERLQGQRDRLSLTDQLKRQRLMLDARAKYDLYAKNYDADLLTRNKPKKMTFDEYVATIPELRSTPSATTGGEQRKVINGVTYVKVGDQWYTE
jgi:hypothetical protein